MVEHASNNLPDFLKSKAEHLRVEVNFPVKPENFPLFIAKAALSKALQPSIRHLCLCGCGNKWLDKFKSDAVVSAKALYEERDLKVRDDDGKIFDNYLLKALNEDSWVLLHKFLSEKGFRCPVEQKTIIEFLLQYTSKYDLGDPDVWNIVEPLLNHKLAVDRYALYSNSEDFVQEFSDKHGNRLVSINPVEELKLKYDRERVSAVEKLNRMIEGSKSSVSLNIVNTVFERDDMYGYKEINQKQ